MPKAPFLPNVGSGAPSSSRRTKPPMNTSASLALPTITVLPSGCRLTSKHPTSNRGSSTCPPVPKPASSVPSALKRAMPHPLAAPTLTLPTSTILPSSCSTSLRPKSPVVPAKWVVATPLVPNAGSSTPLASIRSTRKSKPSGPPYVRPPTTILPSSWIATADPRSLRAPKDEIANCATPLVPNVASGAPALVSRATKMYVPSGPPPGVVPAITLRPEASTANPTITNEVGDECSTATPFVPNDASGAPALVNLATNGTSLDPSLRTPPTRNVPSGLTAMSLS